jgi:hypothetical protein
MLGVAERLLMKIALIAIGLFAITGQSSLAFARGALHLLDPPLNPQHINGLPAEVRNALARMCGGAQAQHPFAGYSQNSRTIVLHFEHLHCADHGAFCTQAGCLHQVYVSAGGRYRLRRVLRLQPCRAHCTRTLLNAPWIRWLLLEPPT